MAEPCLSRQWYNSTVNSVIETSKFGIRQARAASQLAVSHTEMIDSQLVKKLGERQLVKRESALKEYIRRSMNEGITGLMHKHCSVDNRGLPRAV
jgi:hypothetical protein